MTHEQLMALAIQIAKDNVKNGGGPFGAVIAHKGEVLATAGNQVTCHNDPTAHAEICAIRIATAKIDHFSLKGCDIYSSCEPCPMCLSAIYWAHLDRLFYACTKTDAAAAGFDDQFIYDEIALPYEQRQLPSQNMMQLEAQDIFKLWKEKTDKVEY